MTTAAHFIDLLKGRRSIRVYKNQKLPQKLIEQLQEALLRAPTSRAKNPWTFIFTEDPQLLTALASAKAHGSAFLAGAALGVVICADETVSDVWIEDCAIAAITLQYAAHDLGLGSCWAQIRERPHDNTTTAEDYIKNLLGLDGRLKVVCVIGIGMPAEEKPGHPADELPTGKIVTISKSNVERD